MSWESYIDNLILHAKDVAGADHCDKAAIVGLDGSMWTSGAKNLCLTGDEIQKISACFKAGDFTYLQTNGVHIAGIKYQFLRADPKLVLAKKKEHGALTLQLTKTAIVIAHCPEGCQQGNTNKAVGVIADYLEGQGY